MLKLKVKSRNFKFWFAVFIFAFCVLNSIGCATLLDAPKGILGISTRILEKNRNTAIKKEFHYDYGICYNKVKQVLLEKKSYIYEENAKKQMLAIYVSDEDTTPVGIFFKNIDAANIEVAVSSPSVYAKELIAKIIFSELEEKTQTDKKPEAV